MQKCTGIGVVYSKKVRNTKHKQLWIWQVSTVPAKELLTACLPYLKIKHSQAEQFLTVSAANVGAVSELMRRLNQRGSRAFKSEDYTVQLRCRQERFGVVDVPDTTAAYLSGIVDGEGSFHIRKQKRWSYGTLTVSTTALKLAEFLSEFGGNICVKRSKNKNSRPAFYWNAGKQVLNSLLPLLRYLKIKKEHAGLVFSFNKSKDAALSTRLTELNIRGATI